MFGELNGGDSMMETLGLQFKDKIYDDMKTDEHTDERMEAMREQELLYLIHISEKTRH